MIHEITVKDLMNFKDEHMALFASNTNGNKGIKKLFVSLRGHYEVNHKGTVILKTKSMVKAVSKYNEL